MEQLALYEDHTLTLRMALSGESDKLRVHSAIIDGKRIVEGMDGQVICDLPKLNDVVSASRGLAAPADVRFVIREAASRIKASLRRAKDIANLRNHYHIEMNSTLDELVITTTEGVTVGE